MRILTLSVALVALVSCLDESSGGEESVRETGYFNCVPAPEACGTDEVQCFGPDGAPACESVPECAGPSSCACAADLCGERACVDQAEGFACLGGVSPAGDGGVEADGGPDANGVDRGDGGGIDLDGGVQFDRGIRPVADSSSAVCTANENADDCAGTSADCIWNGYECLFAAGLREDVDVRPSSLDFGEIENGETAMQTVELFNGNASPIEAPWLFTRLGSPAFDLEVTVYTDDPEVDPVVYLVEDLDDGQEVQLPFDLPAMGSIYLDVTARSAEGAQQHAFTLATEGGQFGTFAVIPVSVD